MNLTDEQIESYAREPRMNYSAMTVMAMAQEIQRRREDDRAKKPAPLAPSGAGETP